MKVRIEAKSQQEFDSKRKAIIKALSGKPKTRYDDEKPPTAPRKSFYRAQSDIIEHYSAKFNETMSAIKKEIAPVLEVSE